MSQQSQWTFKELVLSGIGYIYQDKKILAVLIKDVDGYWYFDKFSGEGLWSTNGLRDVADFVDELNEPWNKEVEEGLKNA